MIDPIVLIPCGGAKLTEPAPARELYTGSQFRLGLQAALALTDPGYVRIVSARHGLVTLDQELAPYDVRMGTGDPDEVCPSRLRLQLRDVLADNPERVTSLVSLLPRAYHAKVADAARLLKVVYPSSIPESRLAGTRGIGDQRAVLSAIAHQEVTR